MDQQPNHDEATPGTAFADVTAERDGLRRALKAILANHCGNAKLFCSTCTPAREVFRLDEGDDDDRSATATTTTNPSES